MLRERFGRFCRAQARSIVLALVFGAGFSLIFSLGREHGIGLVYTAAVGAIIGLAIWVWIMTLAGLFQPGIDRMPPQYRAPAHALVFFAAAILGWYSGMIVAAPILHVNIRGMFTMRGLPYLGVAAACVVGVGLVFRTIEIMRQRLAESMQKLQETEWARKEIELARSIQTRLLPPQTIDGQGFSIAARNFPAHLVAGDFYDVVQFDDGSIAVVVGDVAGKGMGASLIMASVKAVLPFVGRSSVEDAMTVLNDKLVQELDRREFVALAYARFFPANGTLLLANAGFPDPYLIRGGVVQTLTVPGMRLPLGVRSHAHYETFETRLQPNDRIVFVSDGIPEAPVESAEEVLGYDRLVDALRVGNDQGADAWLEELLGRIRRGVREPLEDDWTALVLQFTAGARAVA